MYFCATQVKFSRLHTMYLKTLFIVIIVNFVSDSYGQRAKKFFRKDYTYIEAVESFYKVYPVPYNWLDAKRMCALEGAVFWHPENQKELDAVIPFWTKDKPLIDYVWTALSDILAEGQFETIDGRPSSEVYVNWARNSPNNLNGNEDCTHLEPSGVMSDYNCDHLSHFICKKTLESLQWNYPCDMPDLDYTFSKDIGKCFKLHTTPLNWTEANAMCQLEQSTLAVINNQVEADYLVKLAISTPKARVKGKYQRGIYHLGFHNRFNDGWQTIKGTPLNVEPEAWFDNYQPYEDYEECGSMFFDGRLVNINCDLKCLFICERRIKNVLPVTFGLDNAQPYIGGGVD